MNIEEIPVQQQTTISSEVLFPQVPPLIVIPDESELNDPVTKRSRLELRLLIEFFSHSFSEEGKIIFSKPNLEIEYTAFNPTPYQAWIYYEESTAWLNTGTTEERNTIQDDETFFTIAEAKGCFLFLQPDELTPEEKETSSWVLTFAWLHPSARKKGLFSTFHSKHFQTEYPNYWILGPVSPAMQRAMTKNEIGQARLLTPEPSQKSL